MAHIFISHAEEDKRVATELAELLKAAGYDTWHYEQDSRLGLSYLEQVALAVEKAGAFVIILSRAALRSHQVDRELSRAHEFNKPLIPLLLKLTHEEFNKEKPAWSFVVGSTVTLPIPSRGISSVVPQVVEYLRKLSQGNGAAPLPLLDSPPEAPAPRLKLLWRAVARRPVRAAAVALCAVAAAVLLYLLLVPSDQLEISKAGLFEAKYADGRFEYSFDVEVTNYGFKTNRIADMDASVELVGRPDVAATGFDQSDPPECRHAETNAAVEFPYDARPIRTTARMRCTITIRPDENTLTALRWPNVRQQLTVVFKGKNDEPYPQPLRLCFDLDEQGRRSTGQTPC